MAKPGAKRAPRKSRTIPKGSAKLTSARGGRPRDDTGASKSSRAAAKADAAASSTDRPRGSRDLPGEATPFPVVGVGASAGGLEAFSKLLSKIPPESRLAMVLVQHLSPSHESHLAELLGNAGSLAILQAQNGMRIEPGRVYVIPPDSRMSVVDGVIDIGQRPSDRTQYTPIDYFFESLAAYYQERAIAVVLSGTASDGAVGMGAVKGAGGITFVQDPSEAKFDSMPRAAVAAGAVDAVLPVERIAAELVRLSCHPFLLEARSDPEREGEQQPGTLRQVFQILRKSSGVDFTHYKLPTIMRRIQRRMALHRLMDLDAYASILRQQPHEVEELYEDLLIHVTGFFREPEAFEALKDVVFPAILRAREGDGPIRAWVPGCSSGEEVYSLAIALYEFLGDRADSTPFQIFGTDVSQRMIDKARAGVFLEAVAREAGTPRLRRFFTQTEGSYRINKTLREHCVFSRQDLTRDPPFSKLDLVVCRNLLIYLGYPLQRKVMTVFHYGLKPTGFLMLGRSETTSAHADLFALVDKKQKIYAKKPVLLTGQMEFAGVSPNLPTGFERPRATRASANPSRDDGAGSEVNRLILERYGPPGVLVDSEFHIVRTRGRTGRYLELASGEAKLDLMQMVREGLLYGLRTALREARSRGIHVRKEGLHVRTNGTSERVNVDVTPIGSGSDRRYLVLFEQPPDGKPPLSPAEGSKAKKAGKGAQGKTGSDTVKRLETELMANREYLQSIIEDLESANEELQSANEEILSSNEELQSTNEELDTAREELQSTNEELNTLNEELRSRNDELSRVNGDLLNLLASVHLAIVMVTTDLRIRRFIPAAEKMLNLIPGDVGRPIAHIKPNIHCPNLEELIADVIDNVTVHEREVEDQQGNVYSLCIRPYKSIENKIDGAVLTLIDVSNLRVMRKYGDTIMNNVSEPILLLNEKLEVVRSNPAFQGLFNASARETEGQSLFALGDRQWDVPKVRSHLQEVLPDRKAFKGVEVEGDFPGVGRKRILLDGHRLDVGDTGAGYILLLFHDVTST